MSFVERWLRNPQSVWLRKAIFQVHLWTGIGVGLYLLVVSVSGSVVVFRVELATAFSPTPTIVAASGDRMTLEEVRAAAEEAYPDHEVMNVWDTGNPNETVEIWLDGGGATRQRLFNPYTGEDLGNALPFGFRCLSWFLDLHDNLLYGETGRTLNGVGALLLTLLSMTGTFIWWPGIQSWRRSLFIQRKVGWKRFNWNLHSVVGFWAVVFIFVWGVSGVYLSIPALVDYVAPFDPLSLTGDWILRWLTRLHFGRFAGLPVKILWAIVGLAPACLFVTGALMWWNRVLNPSAQALRRRDSAPSGDPTGELLS